MKVGLFIPCYIDQLYPSVGIATLELLEHFGVQVGFPEQQTCCGQPMANTGCFAEAEPLAVSFVRTFESFDYVVGPTGSCVSMVRHHYADLVGDLPAFETVRQRTYELCEFLVDVLQVTPPSGRFPHRVGIHQSCHGLRELRMASSSEVVGPSFSKLRVLLESLEGIEFVQLERPDECCGFGGTFSVNEEAVSCMMGLDRVHDHEQSGTEVLTAADMSCLMHLDGLIRRNGKPLRVMHVAELLSEGWGLRQTTSQDPAAGTR